MLIVRLLIGMLVLAIVAVGAVPLLVLLDLLGGGDGLGLCPRGVNACENGYFKGPELAFWLIVLMFGLLGVLRLFVLLHRNLQRDRGPMFQS